MTSASRLASRASSQLPLSLRTGMRRMSGALIFALAPLGAMAAEAGKGMPQLDFANPLTRAQVVWGAIIFLVLYVLLSRWALPQVASV